MLIIWWLQLYSVGVGNGEILGMSYLDFSSYLAMMLCGLAFVGVPETVWVALAAFAFWPVIFICQLAFLAAVIGTIIGSLMVLAATKSVAAVANRSAGSRGSWMHH